MMIFTPFALGLLAVAVAQDNGARSSSTETLALRCVTQSGPSSRAVLATNTRTPALTTRAGSCSIRRNIITSNITTTPVTTVTPSLIVETAVVNLTLTNTQTQSQNASVFTITSTRSVTAAITVVATNISTSIATEFVNSTTSATIAASTNFVPIQSGILLQGGTTVEKRDELVARARRPAAQMVVQDDGTIAVTPRQYPVRVQCLKVLYVTITRFRTIVDTVSTVTASAVRTTVTSTILANATEVQEGATQFITASAVTTVSSTVTVVQSTFTVSTTTSTIFSTFPTPFYAACARDNIARAVDGVAIGRVGLKNLFGTLSANNPYDCCVRGIQGDYAGTFFQRRSCFLIGNAVPGVCVADEQAFTFGTVATLDAGDAIVLSNGNCGQGVYVETQAQ